MNDDLKPRMFFQPMKKNWLWFFIVLIVVVGLLVWFYIRYYSPRRIESETSLKNIPDNTPAVEKNLKSVNFNNLGTELKSIDKEATK